MSTSWVSRTLEVFFCDEKSGSTEMERKPLIQKSPAELASKVLVELTKAGFAGAEEKTTLDDDEERIITSILPGTSICMLPQETKEQKHSDLHAELVDCINHLTKTKQKRWPFGFDENKLVNLILIVSPEYHICVSNHACPHVNEKYLENLVELLTNKLTEVEKADDVAILKQLKRDIDLCVQNINFADYRHSFGISLSSNRWPFDAEEEALVRVIRQSKQLGLHSIDEPYYRKKIGDSYRLALLAHLAKIEKAIDMKINSMRDSVGCRRKY